MDPITAYFAAYFELRAAVCAARLGLPFVQPAPTLAEAGDQMIRSQSYDFSRRWQCYCDARDHLRESRL